MGGVQVYEDPELKALKLELKVLENRFEDLSIEASEIENVAAQYLEFMIHGFMNGLITLQELEGISNEEMETIYALGYNFFTYGNCFFRSSCL